MSNNYIALKIYRATTTKKSRKINRNICISILGFHFIYLNLFDIKINVKHIQERIKGYSLLTARN